jgi:hypothetical protein
MGFTVTGETEISILPNNKTVTVTVPWNTDRTSLTPAITISPGAAIEPASGMARNFSNGPVKYTVTAEDGTEADWTVTVELGLSPEAAIMGFTIGGQTGESIIDEGEKTVAVTVPWNTDRTGLTPDTFTISEKAGVSPESDKAQNFTGPVIYTVTAEDGSQAEWTVTVELGLSPEAKITAFTISGQTEESIIHEGNKTVTVTFPWGTNLTNLTPNTFTISEKAGVSPPSDAEQNFTTPVIYTVTAEDGTTAEWTVTAVPSLGAGIAALTDAANGKSADDPVALTLSGADLGNGGWAALLTTISGAGKYVALDLSVCTMGDGVTEFDPGPANTGESKIVSLVLPDAATSTKAGSSPNFTFRYFTALTSVTGENVTTVGEFAFGALSSDAQTQYGLTTLTTVNFPNAITISRFAFYNCTSLDTVNLPKVETIGLNAFAECKALTEISFPEAIDIGGFQNSGLIKAYLPKLTTVTGYFFNGCASLTTVTLGLTAPTISGSNIFNNVSNITVTVIVPKDATGYDGNWPDNFKSGGSNINLKIVEDDEL